MSNEQDLALAKALMDRGEIDAAEELIEKLEHIAKAQQAAADAGDDDQDDEDALDDTDDDGDGEDDGQDDDEDDVAKSFREGGITYPHSDDQLPHQNMQPPPTRALSPQTYATGITDVVQRPGRHPFDDAVDRVMQRDGSSRNAAMVTARVENPRLYDDYQRAHASDSTSAQSMSRVWSQGPLNKLGLPKSPPIYPDSDDADLQDSGKVKAKSHRRRHRLHNQQVKKMTYEDAVAGEMARGCNRVVAEQRVQHSFGNLLPRSNVAKGAGDTPIVKFMDKVDQCMINEDVDRTEAMRRVRKRNEGLFDAFQIV
jgi:hypothetical protein